MLTMILTASNERKPLLIVLYISYLNKKASIYCLERMDNVAADMKLAGLRFLLLYLSSNRGSNADLR